MRWLVANPGAVDADPKRLAVGGDSAGGNLAASVALSAAAEGVPLALQLLIYPATWPGGRSGSHDLFDDGFYLTGRWLDLCQGWVAPNPLARSDPRLAVALAEVSAGTAPAVVVTAGFDPLRDEGRAYAAKLAEAGVPTELVEFPDMIHSFFNQVSAGTVAPAHNREIACRLAAGMDVRRVGVRVEADAQVRREPGREE